MRLVALAAVLSAVIALAPCFDPVRAEEEEAPPFAPLPAASGGVAFEPGPPPFADVLAKAKAAKKLVFVDFAPASCGWCRKLEAEVLSTAAAGETMRAFVNVRLDPDQGGEHAELAKRYRVRGYPTLLVLDATGTEIDRVVGFEPLDEFDADMKRILRGEGTIADVRKRQAAAPGDPALALEYAEKLAPSDPEAAGKLFAAAAASKTADRPTVLRARIGRIGALTSAKQFEDAMKEAGTLLAEKGDDVPVGLVLSYVYPAVHGGVDGSRALALLDTALQKAAGADVNSVQSRISISYSQMDVHQRAVVESLRLRVAAASALQARQPGNPNAWMATDNAAWTCLQMKRNLTEAIQWARTAVERSREEPTTLDTLAHLLWFTCEFDEALKLEERAAAKTTGAEKREYAGTLAKWKVEHEMRKADGDAEGGDADQFEEVADDNYVGVQGPCGK